MTISGRDLTTLGNAGMSVLVAAVSFLPVSPTVVAFDWLAAAVNMAFALHTLWIDRLRRGAT